MAHKQDLNIFGEIPLRASGQSFFLVMPNHIKKISEKDKLFKSASNANGSSSQSSSKYQETFPAFKSMLNLTIESFMKTDNLKRLFLNWNNFFQEKTKHTKSM